MDHVILVMDHVTLAYESCDIGDGSCDTGIIDHVTLSPSNNQSFEIDH